MPYPTSEYIKSLIDNSLTHNWSQTGGVWDDTKWICRKCGATKSHLTEPPKYFEYSCEEKIMREALK